MLDFEVGRCTRRCADTERDLLPGEMIYSALVSAGGAVERRDFAEDAWQGPPEKTIGWWKSQVPLPSANKVNWAPNDIILDFFDQLAENQDERDTRYVLALLMARRRIVRVAETETDDGGELLVLFCPRNETEYRVPVAIPDLERARQIQGRLAELLFDAPGASQEKMQAADGMEL